MLELEKQPPEQSRTRLLQAGAPGTIEEAAAAIRRGDLVVFPTDTVYGVGSSAFDDAAIRRLYAAKERPFHKSIPILLADPTDLDKVARDIPPVAAEWMARYWPGPLTLIVPKRPDLPPSLSENDTIAVRIPDSDVARAVIRAAGGAVAATSANRSGEPAAQTAVQARAALHGRVAIILDGGPTGQAQASTVVDCTGPAPRVLRQGPLHLPLPDTQSQGS